MLRSTFSVTCCEQRAPRRFDSQRLFVQPRRDVRATHITRARARRARAPERARENLSIPGRARDGRHPRRGPRATRLRGVARGRSRSRERRICGGGARERQRRVQGWGHGDRGVDVHGRARARSRAERDGGADPREPIRGVRRARKKQGREERRDAMRRVVPGRVFVRGQGAVPARERASRVRRSHGGAERVPRRARARAEGQGDLEEARGGQPRVGEKNTRGERSRRQSAAEAAAAKGDDPIGQRGAQRRKVRGRARDLRCSPAAERGTQESIPHEPIARVVRAREVR